MATNPDPLISTLNHPQETIPAAEAFARYIALGPTRSLRNLARAYVETGDRNNLSTALRQFKYWSTRYQWQVRLRTALAHHTTRALEEALEIDAETFLSTSRKLRDLLENHAETVATVIAIRGAVKPPNSKPSATVNPVGIDGMRSTTVDLQVRELAERIAREEGVDPEILLKETDAFVQALSA